MLRRKMSPSKRPSTMRVRSKLSSQSQGNGLAVPQGNVPTPKTRFSINDGSCSIPPLKSFPAEPMRKSEVPLTQNSPENVEVFGEMQNSGQGDTVVQRSGFQTHSLSHPLPLPSQNISSVSEQQVPRVSRPVTEQVNQSEHGIPSSIGVASNERPLHRPNVPYANTRIINESPRKLDSHQLTRPHQSVPRTEMSAASENEPNQHQYRDPWRVENDSITLSTPAKRTIGPSYPSFYRPSTQLDKNESVNTNDAIAQRSIASPTGSNIRHVAERKPSGWSQPHQIYQGNQPNMPNYRWNKVENDESKRQVVESNSVMKSSQDVAMNQNQSWRKTMRYGSDVQNNGIQNNTPQQQPYTMNIAPPGNNNQDPTVCYQQIRQRELQSGFHSHPISQNDWQTQEKQYHQMDQNSSQPQPTQVNYSKPLDSGHQLQKEEDKSKGLKFTPAMIRDQEMSVTTMRQQGIPEEIMRRQFDALLAEQRKQLLYSQQLEQSKSNDSQSTHQGRRVQRKISKIEEEGKPEWMLHITPPRIPYSLIENMRTEKAINSQHNENTLNSVGTPTDLPQQMHKQEAHEHYRNTSQNSGSNYAQQQMLSSHNCSGSDATNQHQAHTVTGHHGGQPQMPHNEYPIQQQHYIQQVPQESSQVGPNNTRKEMQQTGTSDHAGKTVEPSSLLRLRLDKEVIRQQKQNNGLQDPATVKEAMEALKNPSNRKGLEYLENLNKKPDKVVSLNGAQDPQELSYLLNGPQSAQCGQYLCQHPKIPSANGLENQRNSNNPSTPSILQRKKLEESQWPEYPRQKTKSALRDCYSLVAERENGTVASANLKDPCKSNLVTQRNMTAPNPSCHMHIQPRQQNSGQTYQDIAQTNEKASAGPNSPFPFTVPQQNQHQYHVGQTQQLHKNPSNYGQANVNNGQSGMTLQPGFGGHFQQQYNNRSNEIQEMIISGGLKYLARKPKYIPNSSYTSHHNSNPGQYYNPSVSCQ